MNLLQRFVKKRKELTLPFCIEIDNAPVLRWRQASAGATSRDM